MEDLWQTCQRNPQWAAEEIERLKAMLAAPAAPAPVSEFPDAIRMGFRALAMDGTDGVEWNRKNCKCEPEVGPYPCEYCAIHGALHTAIDALSARSQESAAQQGPDSASVRGKPEQLAATEPVIKATPAVSADPEQDALVERLLDLRHDETFHIRQEAAAALEALQRRHVADCGYMDALDSRAKASEHNFAIEHDLRTEAERRVAELTAELAATIPVADIEAEIAHIQQNGMNVSALPGMVDEGRCRELCAMYLREFITARQLKQQVSALASPAKGEES